MKPTTTLTVDEYISSADPGVRPILETLRQTILHEAPEANERISYGIPFYEYGGAGIKGRLLYFAAFKKHISLFITPQRSTTLPEEITKYHTTKATYQFRLDEPFPFDLIGETVRRLVAERRSE